MTNGRHRRSSVFTGLLLILIGVIFLLQRFDPALGIGRMVRVYWPVLLILWGVARLIDYMLASRGGQARPAIVGGGEVVLLVLLGLVLSGFAFRDWIHQHYPNLDVELAPFRQPYSQSQELEPRTMPAGAHVLIDTARGDITVRGEAGNDLRVTANKSASGPTESAANAEMKAVDVVVEQTGDLYRIHPARQQDVPGRVTVGLEVTLPKTASLTVHTASGDITVSEIAGNIDARTEHGDVEIHEAGSDVTADVQHGDVRITGVGGNVRLTGRGDDVEIGDITGDATVDGAFLGSIRLRNVAKTARCMSPWTDVSIAHLTGQLELDAGDLSITNANGAASVVTRNKDIDVENVSGRLDIKNVHGDIEVKYAAPPHDDANITNDSGSVDITLPAQSSFSISAVSRSGDVQSDFGERSVTTANEGDTEQFHGQFGGTAGATLPTITVATTYGTIHLRKGR